MFSSASKRANPSSRKDRTAGHRLSVPGSPATPAAENQKSSYYHKSIPDRPSSGTPAPWATRLSVLARYNLFTDKVDIELNLCALCVSEPRIPAAHKGQKEDEADPTKPVFVGEFPQMVRDEQTAFLRKRQPGDACVSGGMDKATCLSWLICGSRLFLWSHSTSATSRKCIVLELPSGVLGDAYSGIGSQDGKTWLVSVVGWDNSEGGNSRHAQSRNSVGVVICNKKTRALVYWPEIYAGREAEPIINLPSSDGTETTLITPTRQHQTSGHRNSSSGSGDFNSMIMTAVSTAKHVCVALVCSSNGELWQFHCSPTSIQRKKVHSLSGLADERKGYPRSMVWLLSQPSGRESVRQFLLLTDHEILCFGIKPYPDLTVSKVWCHEIVGIDGDSGIKKDLASQKQIWPLDLQVDDHGKVITVVVATICIDRTSSSSYTQYSLLFMQQKSGTGVTDDANKKVLEKKAPNQVIIPKARVENEDFLLSMRLRVGGRPSGSAIILSDDGTATVSYFSGNATRLYKFDLPYDAGKVLDASVLPSTDHFENGAWILLTEKAGVWAIPEKAIVIGGVEPPERSLSRNESADGRSFPEETRNSTFRLNVGSRRGSSVSSETSERKMENIGGIERQTARDEESEALLSQLYEEFLLSGNVDASLQKLQKSGAFERDGETSVFARKSKSIVDTLAKHWTATRGAEIVAMSILSAQLVDKQQKHQEFLHFLALSKCHEELCSKQRHSLQIILEHGEKLAGMIQLRELQNLINQSHSGGIGSRHSGSEKQVSCAIWDLIQLVGERARRNTVLLMDRDNAEVFYSKVSAIEEVFVCLDRQLEYILSAEQALGIQFQRVCELSNVCVTVLRAAMQYRNEHQMWYPPFEGLTPWYSQFVVRSGLWRVASCMLQLLNEASGIDMAARSEMYSHLQVLTEVLLEAYTGAITAKVEQGEEYKGLLDEYWSRRDTLFDSLYQQVKKFVESGYQGMKERFEESDDDVLKKLSSDMLTIAKRHEGYKIMWKICYDLNDTVLLKTLMHDSMGPQGGFSYFVFKQLYEMKQYSKLLRLGEEFQEELLIFLKRHNDLLWLHEVFLHQFSPASDTLHALVFSQDENSMTTEEKETALELENPKQTLSDRKRYLNLAKISAMADKGADSMSKVARISADLKLLKLQEEITKVLPANDTITQQLLRPEELVDLCLNSQSAELALLAFDVFAWTSSSFREAHVTLLGDCWRNTADQDNWGQLYEASLTEGWSEEETLQKLRDTALFRASSRCYGPQAQTVDGGFDDVLPLRQMNTEIQVPKYSSESVEAILMQHKDFSEAGKLMLTAVMLGSMQDDAAEAFSPMK